MRRRGLGDVLHYFISEEEQADARKRAHTPQAARAPRWCLPASPKRPLSCAVAIDLAVAAARSGLETEILAPFAQEELMLKSAEIGWRALDFSTSPPGREALERALEEVPHDKPCFVVLFPEHLGPVLRKLTPGYLDGLLLPIDAAPSGPAQALAILRQLPRLLPELRIGAVLVGAASAHQARELFLKVQGATRRQLGLEIEDLGEVRRDPASFRSLLRGVSVLEIDEDASSAQSLRAVCRRLLDMRAAPDPLAAPGA